MMQINEKQAQCTPNHKLTLAWHSSLMASAMERQTTYCMRGNFLTSCICDVKENMRHPGGDSHTFFDLPA